MAHTVCGVAVAIALVTSGCKDSKPGDATAASGQPAVAIANAAASLGGTPPARAADTSALWALAPPNAAGGFVVADGELARLYTILDEVQRVAKARPSSARVYEQIAKRLVTKDVDPLDRASVAAWGIDLDRGFAIFFDEDMEVLSGVLPIKSLDVLVRHGDDTKLETVNGRQVARSADGDVCTEAAGRILCGQNLATIDASVKTGGGAIAKHIAATAADARGAIELVLDSQRIVSMKRQLADAGPSIRDPGVLIVAVRHGAGQIEAHASFEITFPLLDLGAPDTMPASFRGLDRGAVGLVRLHLDPKAILAAVSLPASIPLPGGVDVRTDLIDQLSGDFAVVTRGASLGSGMIGIGLRDSARAARALPAVCRLLASQLPQATIAVVDGACHASMAAPPIPNVPPGLIPASLTANLVVRAGALWLELGDPAVAADAPTASARTAPLLGEQHLVMWARSLDPLAAVTDQLRAVVDRLVARYGDDKQRDAIDVVRWWLAHVAETGIAIRRHDGAYHAHAVLVTYAADPPEHYHAYEAAVQQQLDGDYAGYRAAMKALAATPTMLVGRQAALVEAGVTPVGAGSGIGLAVAIPAFVKYIERAKAGRGH